MKNAGHDTNYLKETVGEALARGCAATISAHPNDPVEYLGLWLLKYVKNAEVEGEFYKDRQKQLQQKKERMVNENVAEQSAKTKALTRKQAVEALAELRSSPRELLQAAVDLIKRHTAAGAAYAAFVTDPEEPDWVPPEDDEEAAVESEDEVEVPAPTGEEGEEGAAPEPPAEEEPPAEDEGEDGEPKPAKIPRPVDYSKKYFAYAAASAGQEHVLGSDLRRPAPPPEDADEDFKPEPVPYTFRILDEKLPMLYLPNVAGQERVKFFRRFPKIGAYQAVGVPLGGAGGEFKALVAADTLFPEGGGQPLPADDKDFVWEVAQALATAMDAVAGSAAEALQSGREAAAEGVAALLARVRELRVQAAEAAGATAAPADGEEGEEGEEAGEEAEAPPEPEEQEAEEEEEGEEEGEEGEGGEEGEEGEEPKPKQKKKKKAFDPIPGLKAALGKAEKEREAAETAEAQARSALELEQQALGEVVQAASASAGATLYALLHFLTVPQATFHIVKALLNLLGKEPSSFATWKRAASYFTPTLFEEMAGYDATAERDMGVWGAVRSCYKAVDGTKQLEQEMPSTLFGVVALLYIKQVRRVARKAVVHRAAAARLDKAQADVATRTEAVEEAERKKAEEEEEARLAEQEEARRAEEEAAAAAAAEAEAAAAAAAAEAAAAAAGGEGQEGGAGEGEGEGAEGEGSGEPAAEGEGAEAEAE